MSKNSVDASPVNVNVPVSEVYRKIHEAMKASPRYVILQGGTRSTKTYSVLQYLICRALSAQKLTRLNFYRSKLSWMKDSLIRDFRDILTEQFNLWNEKNYNKGDQVYRLEEAEFTFRGLDLEHGFLKAHGLKGDISFFNECTELEYNTVRQIMLRSPGVFFFDFNPNCGPDHWIYSKIMTRQKVAFIKSTFRDNPFLPPEQVMEILEYEPTEVNIRKGTADETLWKIYGLGERAVVSGLVFGHYSIVPEFPKDAEKVSNGLDFGFSGDPSACIKTGIKDGNLYLDELFYKRGLTTIKNPHNPGQPNIEDHLRNCGIRTQDALWCDAERPDSIQDLRNCGFNAKAAAKGPGSVLYGIQVMKQYRLCVTERSMNLIKEFNNYKWLVDKQGEPTKIPVDRFNHGIDAARYAARMTLGEGTGTRYCEGVHIDLMTPTFADA